MANQTKNATIIGMDENGNLVEVYPITKAENVDGLYKVVSDLVNEVTLLKATLDTYGIVRISDSEAVTDSTGLALAATEKNAAIEGTLANQILNVENKSFPKKWHVISTAEEANRTDLYGIYSSWGDDLGMLPNTFGIILAFGPLQIFASYCGDLFSRYYANSKWYPFCGIYSTASKYEDITLRPAENVIIKWKCCYMYGNIVYK